MVDLLAEAQSLSEITCAIRRDLHRHPELGFEEVRTAGIVAAELRNLGLEVTTGMAKTGVVALVEGARPGPVVLARFDMDALPIFEETGAVYASETPGKMHACGHDGHVAIGLTVARLLTAHRDELAGTVKLMFQPAEEGLGGAEGILRAGVLENPTPDACLALHLWNEKPLGWLGVGPGPKMAGSEIFKVKLTGKGGHGAQPHQGIDPVVASAQVITALQTVVSRNISPLQAAVVSVTQVHAGDAFNVIPPSAELRGTIRTFDPTVRQTTLRRFLEVVQGVAEAMGCQAETEVNLLTPTLVNDAGLAEVVRKAALKLMPDADIDANDRTMGSEDMAFILQKIPGCYFFVGSANPDKGLTYGHHHPKFDFDEAALPRAAALMAAALMDVVKLRLRRKASQ
jgi:amidohydrolase